MDRSDSGEVEVGSLRHFAVDFLIAHPSAEPEVISHALGIEPTSAHRVGDRRKTRKGTLLDGNYRDTRWRYTCRHNTSEQWFSDKVTELIDRLEPHKEFLKELAATGGRMSLNVQLLGGGYFGDVIGGSTLRRIVDLGLDLGMESYSVPQW